MSEKKSNSQNRNQKDVADSMQEVQKLYKDLRKRRVPVAIAALICAAVVGFGVWSGTHSGGPAGQQGKDQIVQEQETDQIAQERETDQAVQEQETDQAAQKQETDQSAQKQETDQVAQQEQNKDSETSYTFRTEEQLADHYERHGIEMGFEDEEAYVAGANRVISSPDALHKLEAEDGDDVYYLEESNEFVVVSKQGYIRTYFEPTDGRDYYERQ